MTPEANFLEYVLKGNDEAVDFITSIGQLTQIWDDLVDGDDPTTDQINKMMWEALVILPSNGFYNRHFVVLQPLLRAGIFDWLSANELERGDQHDRTLAFILRDSIVALVVQCALIIGGYDWAKEQAADIRRFFHDETLKSYLEGLS